MVINRYEILGEKLQLKRYFHVEHRLLYIFGFNFNSKENFFYRRWLPYSSIATMLLTMIGMLHFSYVHIQNVDYVADAMAPFLQGLMVTSKFFSLVRNRREIVDLVHRIWDLTEAATGMELQILMDENKQVQLSNSIYWYIMFADMAIAAIAPFFVGVFAYIREGKFMYKVTLTATYPINMEDPLNYILIYIWNINSILAAICVLTGLDTVFFWCAQNIGAQFRILQYKLEEFSGHQNSNERNSKLRGRKAIVDWIVRHQKTIELAKNLDKLFRPIAFTQYSMNSLLICLIVYQLGRDFEITRGIALVFFLAIALQQMLVYSRGGQYIEDESEKVAVAVFNNVQWGVWTLSECKMMQMAILRSHQSCKMTAIFFHVNMNLFLSVLQTAGSYVALLKNLT